MGEIAEMMMDGDLCEGCGVYMEEGNGFPQHCDACRKQLENQTAKPKKTKLRKQASRG